MSEWLYENTKDNMARFILGEKGTNPLICIGVNPSTAEPDKPDPTIRTVKRYSAMMGFDGWMMLNLYPQRAIFPPDLDDEIYFNSFYHQRNMFLIREYTSGPMSRTIWAAWGNTIKIRKYLFKCLRDIALALRSITGVGDDTVKRIWIKIGPLSKSGHPHHPLYLPKNSSISPFDIENYIEFFNSADSAFSAVKGEKCV